MIDRRNAIVPLATQASDIGNVDIQYLGPPSRAALFSSAREHPAVVPDFVGSDGVCKIVLRFAA
jgi:hypothetical protein